MINLEKILGRVKAFTSGLAQGINKFRYEGGVRSYKRLKQELKRRYSEHHNLGMFAKKKDKLMDEEWDLQGSTGKSRVFVSLLSSFKKDYRGDLSVCRRIFSLEDEIDLENGYSYITHSDTSDKAIEEYFSRSSGTNYPLNLSEYHYVEEKAKRRILWRMNRIKEITWQDIGDLPFPRDNQTEYTPSYVSEEEFRKTTGGKLLEGAKRCAEEAYHARHSGDLELMERRIKEYDKSVINFWKYCEAELIHPPRERSVIFLDKVSSFNTPRCDNGLYSRMQEVLRDLFTEREQIVDKYLRSKYNREVGKAKNLEWEFYEGLTIVIAWPLLLTNAIDNALRKYFKKRVENIEYPKWGGDRK